MDISLADIIDRAQLAELLNTFGQMGVRLAQSQLDDTLNADRRARHQAQFDTWLSDRIDSLVVDQATPPATPPAPYYPLIPQTLNVQSRAHRSLDRSAAALIASRAILIATHEATTAHSVGQHRAGELLGAIWKQRVRTTATNEDPDHLAIVGQRVFYNQRFSNGEFWTQERVGCLCGIRIGRV